MKILKYGKVIAGKPVVMVKVGGFEQVAWFMLAEFIKQGAY